MGITITIIGQAPSRRSGRRAFDGASGRRLAAVAGLGGYEDLARAARLENLLPAWPGESADKGDLFPIGRARAAAEAARARLSRRPGVLLLAGKSVARAFGWHGVPFFEWFRVRRARCAVIPHPSGVSHWWNDPANRASAESFLRGVFR